ncbi:MAG: DUF6273 domain-containing protein [Lachnospiraceae bacterium]|nr:DUF6273 domain-containing protein [Lachnospiraceae bacterium]
MSLNLATLNLNDKFSFGKYAVADETPWPIVWQVVHKAETYIACMPVNTIDCREFDAAEPASANTAQRTGGNNQYSLSNIFKWLNSDTAGGQWYDNAKKPHTNDAVNTALAAHPGFLYYFTDDEKAALKTMELTIAKNTVTAGGGSEKVSGKVHLPTYTQMGFGKVNGVSEGDAFDAFKTAASRSTGVHPFVLVKSSNAILAGLTTLAQQWYYMLATAGYNTAEGIGAVIGNTGACDYGNASVINYGVRPVIYFPVSGIITEAFEFGIQPSKTIEGKSRIYDLSKPDVSFRTVLSGNLEGATVQVFATNNAYDASPKWEDCTQAYLNNTPYSFNNATKTASSWGMQLRVVVTKTNAPAVCLTGCAFEIL